MKMVYEDPDVCPTCGSTNLIYQDLIEPERIFVCGNCNQNLVVAKTVVRLSQTQTRSLSCPSCGSELFKPYEMDEEMGECDYWEKCWTCMRCGESTQVGLFVESNPDYGEVDEDEVVVL